MLCAAEAQNAVQGMNGQSIGGRNLIVNAARPLEPRSPRSQKKLSTPGNHHTLHTSAQLQHLL